MSGWGYYWLIDNVVISGQAVTQASITWAPTAGLTPTTGATVTAKPATTTSYTATSTSAGCSTSSSPFTITVNQLPTPTFTTAPGSQVCGKTDVTYTTQAGQSNYVWSGFGTPGTDYTVTTGSISSTSNTVTVQWLTTGSHTVTVNYSNSGNCTGASPASSTTNVLAYPAAYTVTGGGAYCSNDGGQSGSGQTISLSGSQTGVTYTLYLNNSPTSTTQTGTGSALNFVGVLAQGTYTVFATNTSTSCTQFMIGSASITVNAFPNDYAVSSSGTPFNNTGITYVNCGTASIYLSGSDLNTTYTLKRSGTVVTSQPGTGSALTFSVSQIGRYTYTITAANSSCQNGMGSVDVTVYALPTIYNVTGGGVSCSGTPVAIGLSNSDAGVNYQLYRGATSVGSSVTGTGSAISFAAQSTAGTYTVIATNATTGCTQTMSSNAIITAATTPSATISAASSSACSGTGVQVTIVGTGGSSVTYSNGSTSTTLNPFPAAGSYQFNTPTNPGTYTYTITNVSNSTCTGTSGSSTTVTIQSLPAVGPITFGGTSAATQYVQTGLTLQLSDATTGGNWTTNNSSQATVGGSSGLVSGVAAGTPTITYTVTDGTSAHCQNSATQALRVYNPDYVNKNVSANFSDNSNWQINRGDGTFVAAPSAPSGTNQGYNTITVTTPLNMDVDFQLPSGKSFTIATGGTMAILPNITFSSLGAVNFGGQSVTVKSVAPTNTSGTDVTFGTGAIGTMASTILNATNVTAERYIGSTAFSTGRRAWRLITAPVTGTTVNGAWQEGLVSNTTTPTVGNSTYGTLITGNQQGTASNAFSNGYDFWPQVANTYSSLRYYIAGSTSSLGSSWASYPSIKTLQINAQPAYMLFVRGNRSVESSNYPAGITTLRATGTLNQGTATTPVSGTSTYTLVGNPYASAIDFDKVWNANSGVIQDRFVEWNSQNGVNGAFALVQGNGAGSYTVVPSPFTGNPAASSNAQYIVSGQGFFVQPASSTNGSLAITDNTKVSASTAVVNPYRISPSTEQKLYVNLNLAGSDSTTTLADGIMERFDPTYSAAIDGDDAPKQINFNENLGIESHSTDLIVEARPSVQKTDTVQLKLWNVSARPYQLQVKADQFALAAAQGLHAYLEDSYLKTREELSLTGSVSTIPFTVTGDAASYDLHRFRIVFQSEATVLPLTLTSVKAALQNSGVAISWTVQNEENIRQYVVERSTDGGATFTVIAEQKAKNLTGVALSDYAGFDAQPHRGSNLYRIRVEAADGRVTYSNTAKAVWGEDGSGKTLITLYPNPVSRREGRTTLTLSHLKEGAYLAGVYSEGGQSVMQKKITVAAGTEEQTEELPLGAALAQGSYEVRLTDSKGVLLFKSHLIISK